MIATVTLNPSVDLRYMLSAFEKNGVYRCNHYQRSAGGKGLNVTRVLRILGDHVRATGFLGGKNGEYITQELEKLGAENQFVQIEGETRNCIAIVTKEPSQTELLEQGPLVSEENIALFLNIYETLLEEMDWISASGSLPPGVAKDFYKLLGEKARKHGKKFILDSSGESLLYGLEANPFLVKPNKEELEDIFKKRLNSVEQIVDHAKELCHRGAQNVIISLGEEGAILVNPSLVLKASIPKIDVVNPIGSGDSMIAGYLHALVKGESRAESLKFACAVGTANALEEKTGKVNPETLNASLGEIWIDELK